MFTRRKSLDMSDGFERGRLFNTALPASILLDHGEFTEALEHAGDALGMTRRVRSTRARDYLQDIEDRLSTHTSDARARRLLGELKSRNAQAS